MSQDYRVIFQIDETTHSAGPAPSSPTMPSPSAPTSVEPNPSGKTKTIPVSSVVATIRSPIGSAMRAMGRAIPAVAAIIAAGTAANSIATVALDVSATYTGDYSGEIAYSNFKLGFQHAMNPISYGVSLLRQQAEYAAKNRQIEQERVLMGNGYANGATKAGV